MEYSSLQDALKASGWRRVLIVLAYQAIKLIVDERRQIRAQFGNIDTTRLEYGYRVSVLAQCKQQMLQSSEIVFTLSGERKRSV